MTEVLRWQKRNGLTQTHAASLPGVSQPYLSLLEKGARPLTAELRSRIRTSGSVSQRGAADDLFRARLSAPGYPGFAPIAGSRSRPRPDSLLMTMLARPDADARVAEALRGWRPLSRARSTSAPWCVRRSALPGFDASGYQGMDAREPESAGGALERPDHAAHGGFAPCGVTVWGGSETRQGRRLPTGAQLDKLPHTCGFRRRARVRGSRSWRRR